MYFNSKVNTDPCYRTLHYLLFFYLIQGLQLETSFVVPVRFSFSFPCLPVFELTPLTQGLQLETSSVVPVRFSFSFPCLPVLYLRFLLCIGIIDLEIVGFVSRSVRYIEFLWSNSSYELDRRVVRLNR